MLHEVSRFRLAAGRWYYLDGDVDAPGPCGERAFERRRFAVERGERSARFGESRLDDGEFGGGGFAVGLGVLQVRKRAARMGRNPATGEPIEIKASKKVAFRAAKELKEAV